MATIPGILVSSDSFTVVPANCTLVGIVVNMEATGQHYRLYVQPKGSTAVGGALLMDIGAGGGPFGGALYMPLGVPLTAGQQLWSQGSQTFAILG